MAEEEKGKAEKVCLDCLEYQDEDHMNHDEFDDDGGGGDNSVPNDIMIDSAIN